MLYPSQKQTMFSQVRKTNSQNIFLEIPNNLKKSIIFNFLKRVTVALLLCRERFQAFYQLQW